MPALTAKEVIPVAEKLGFVFRRQAGSHAVYVRAQDHALAVIPVHPGKTLKR